MCYHSLEILLRLCSELLVWGCSECLGFVTGTVQCSSGSAGGQHLLEVLPTFFFFQTSFVPVLYNLDI